MTRPTKLDQIRFAPNSGGDDRIVQLDAVQRARATQPSAHDLGQLAALLGVMADPTRMRIVAALDATELCVCDLSATIGISESATSHHLRLMREIAIVRTRRAGRRVFYTLDDDHVSSIYRQARNHVQHGSTTGATQ